MAGDTHARLPAAGLRASDAYRLMTDIITPRPIAWVSTLDEDGRRNLAPFSYFQGVCTHPPTIVLGISWRRDGTPKDTLANILALREFTISIVDEAHAQSMNRTCADVGPEIDEWTFLDAEHRSAPSQAVAPARVASAPVSLECRLVHAIPIGRTPNASPSSTLVVGEVVCFVVRDGLLRRDAAGRLQPMDPGQLGTVGRLGGIAYTTTRDRFELERPTAAPPEIPRSGGQ